MGGPCTAFTTTSGGFVIAQIRYIECLFGRVIATIFGFAGIVLFVMLLVGGYKYLTSGGNPKSVEEAKLTLTYAIGGMVVLACAFLILKFVEVFTGAPVTNFVIFH